MAARIESLGASLRPHVKTHKCIEVGRLQRKYGARGITAATLVEARDFAEHGFDDITWALPLVPGRASSTPASDSAATIDGVDPMLTDGVSIPAPRSRSANATMLPRSSSATARRSR